VAEARAMDRGLLAQAWTAWQLRLRCSPGVGILPARSKVWSADWFLGHERI